MKMIKALTLCLALAFLSGCASVDVTKTAKGFHKPTNPNDIEIFKTVPPRAYEELGDITVSGFPAGEVAKMHNAIRSKAAPLGANAVILTSEGLTPQWPYKRFAVGVAIAWKD